MKKCQYCAKEIDYSEMYCSKECEEKSNTYYRNRHKWRVPVNVTYIISVGLLLIGLIFSPTMFSKWGLLGGAAGCIMGGVATILLPSPTEEMIKKHKMIKAQRIFRIYGIVMAAVGAAALVMSLVQFFAK